MCLAQAHASSGDMGAARAELERLLATDIRDTRLSGSFPNSPKKKATWKQQPATRRCTKTWPRTTKGKRGWRTARQGRRP